MLSVNVTVAVCMFQNEIVDPDKNFAYDIVHSYVDDIIPKVTSHFTTGKKLFQIPAEM